MSLEVTVRNNNVEKAMRVLKKKLLKDGMMRELKERQYYQKPSLIKREAKKQAIRRLKKEQRLKALRDGFLRLLDMNKLPISNNVINNGNYALKELIYYG